MVWVWIQDSKKYYLVLEICEGGELFDRIVEKVGEREREKEGTPFLT